jgi:hypothetical protein
MADTLAILVRLHQIASPDKSSFALTETPCR